MQQIVLFIFIIIVVQFYAGCGSVQNETKSGGLMPAGKNEAKTIDISVPPRPRDTVCVDFNGDGYRDIATTSKQAKAAVIFYKNADEFQIVTFDTLIHNRSIASADIDNDGDTDFVALTEYRFGPIFLNDGKGTFTAYDPNLPVLPMAYYIAGGDLNSDGLQDFVVVSEEDTQIMAIYNRGDLRFDPKVFTVPITDTVEVSAEALEEEKSLARKQVSEKTSTVKGEETRSSTEVLSEALNEGKPTGRGFVPEKTSTVRDGETRSSTEVSSEAQDEENTSGRGFVPEKTSRGKGKATRSFNKIKHFVMDDINGDGMTDILFPISGPARKLVIAENTGNEDFSFRLVDIPDAEGPLSSIAIVKQQGIDQPEIAVAQSGPGRVFLFQNDGRGTLTLSDSFNTAMIPLLRMTAFDVNSDGTDELLLTYGAPLPEDSRSPVQVWMRENDRGFRIRDTFKSNGYAAYIGACEFSEEEKAIVLSNIHEHTLTLIYLE